MLERFALVITMSCNMLEPSSNMLEASQTKPTFHPTFKPTMLRLILGSFDIAVAWSSNI